MLQALEHPETKASSSEGQCAQSETSYRNIVYGVKCGDKDCQERYVGETQQSLGARMNQHRRPSSNPAQTSVVYTHLNSTGHAFTLTDLVVLDREEHWHRRGVKEAIWERVENPSLNRKGGLRHSLSHTWDRTVRLIGSRLSHGTSVFCHMTSCQLPEEDREIWSQRCVAYETFSILVPDNDLKCT